VEDLVEAGGEEVERGHDAAVGPEAVLLHDFLVLDRVADVDVGAERDAGRGRVQVDDVGRLLLHVQVRVEPLHEGRLAAAGHADHDAHHRLLLGRRRRLAAAGAAALGGGGGGTGRGCGCGCGRFSCAQER